MANANSTVTPVPNDGYPSQADGRPILYEHDDGRYAVADSAALADFCVGEPAWHRLGPVDIVRRKDGQPSQAAPRYPKFEPFGHSSDGNFTGGEFQSPLCVDAAAPANVLASTALSRAYLLRDVANYIATSENDSELAPEHVIQLVFPLIEDVLTLVEAVQQRIEADRQGEVQAEVGHAE
ncbi:MAG: hypothetical protein AB7L76_12465 [Burkholderiaceae bacterium]